MGRVLCGDHLRGVTKTLRQFSLLFFMGMGRSLPPRRITGYRAEALRVEDSAAEATGAGRWDRDSARRRGAGACSGYSYCVRAFDATSDAGQGPTLEHLQRALAVE